MLLEEVVNVINRDKLLDTAKITGDYLLSGLKDAQVASVNYVSKGIVTLNVLKAKSPDDKHSSR